MPIFSQKGKAFDLNDLLGQLRQLQSMGGVGALLDKLPAHLAARANQMPQGNEKEVRRQVAIICSMSTPLSAAWARWNNIPCWTAVSPYDASMVSALMALSCRRACYL